MPPPNVTGTLHVGHALTMAVQDALVRSLRLDGTEVLYVPGTDHAGLGTYAAVRRATGFRPELPPDERVRAWAEQHRGLISGQLRELGLGCDWDAELHTLDPDYRTLVDGTFRRLAEAGLLYRQARISPWCPSCRSTVPDVEQSAAEARVPVALLALKLARRPHVLELPAVEELWGAVAVAVPPGHPAAGGTAALPTLRWELPTLAAPVEAPRLVVPALREADRELAEAHGLPCPELLDEVGRSLVGAPPEPAGLTGLAGLSREELREATVARFRLRRTTRPVRVVGCGLCGTELTARRGYQWYLRLPELLGPVREALDDGVLRIGPAAVEREARHWLDTARDWCVSRQIAWGQRIPALVCDACPRWAPSPPEGVTREPADHSDRPDRGDCPGCGAPLRPETDVFDTWFNSAHWPLAVTAREGEDADVRPVPASLMTSGRDILFFWFVRLLAIGTFVRGRPPVEEIWLHGLVLDEHGRKMSKSRGNVLTLADGLAGHGRDVLRAALLSACREAEDVRLRPELFTAQAAVRSAAVELAALVADGAGTPGPGPGQGREPDAMEHHGRRAARHARAEVRRHLAACRFDRATEAVTHFAVHVLRRYLRLRSATGTEAVTRALLLDVATVYEPFMPDAADRLRRAAESRPGAVWEVDAELADAVAAVVGAAREAERLHGVTGRPRDEPVAVDATDPAVRPLLGTAWFPHLGGVPLSPAASRPERGFAVHVPGFRDVRLWLPDGAARAVRRDGRRRLRRLMQTRRRLAHRLVQLAAPAGGDEAGAGAAAARQELRARLARAEQDTHELRLFMKAAGEAQGRTPPPTAWRPDAAGRT
ncbi:class I tRNA ligase family protein [Streptomyces sp. WMMC897]|uniref:class I tRNA ligase family protein n=1 Tax=Streptomyces sp. WMMC897 TaxID=3014782 RepID=UPI0022B6D11D|nr:class I tRNA ligase family protein [Streptomyces sp. WMMC897]MCZ7413970.1 class I tRNA ligase family protein [Streptomyces sp. WMMC897]